MEGISVELLGKKQDRVLAGPTRLGYTYGYTFGVCVCPRQLGSVVIVKGRTGGFGNARGREAAVERRWLKQEMIGCGARKETF